MRRGGYVVVAETSQSKSYVGPYNKGRGAMRRANPPEKENLEPSGEAIHREVDR